MKSRSLRRLTLRRKGSTLPPRHRGIWGGRVGSSHGCALYAGDVNCEWGKGMGGGEGECSRMRQVGEDVSEM